MICDYCNGSGYDDDDEICPDCNGEGGFCNQCDEPSYTDTCQECSESE